MTFNTEKYRKACEDYYARWATFDQILYDLCIKYPDHSTRNAVYAKLGIIGRAYATGIERQIKVKQGQTALDQAAEFFFENRAAIDSILGKLANVHEPLALDALKTIVLAHGQLVNLLQGKLRESHAPRSFASKYMHFHCAAVPIYDSIASAQLCHEYRWKNGYQVFTLKGADDEYCQYSLRFWRMYQDAMHVGASVKLLDYYLLWLAEKRWKK